MSESPKGTSFSRAHRPRHPSGVDPDDPNLFGHGAPSSTDASRRARQGEGPCQGNTDGRFFSNFPPDPAHPTNATRGVERDSDGHFAFSENLSAGAQEVADRTRKRER
jgi:hypothetical protein